LTKKDLDEGRKPDDGRKAVTYKNRAGWQSEGQAEVLAVHVKHCGLSLKKNSLENEICFKDIQKRRIFFTSN